MSIVFLVTEFDPSVVGHCGFQCVIHVLDFKFYTSCVDFRFLLSGFSFQLQLQISGFRVVFKVLEFFGGLGLASRPRSGLLGLDFRF